MLKNLVRRFLYASGALSLYHRLRNADSLTVVMFHRTLDPGDPRWPARDPDYTLPRAVFARSLVFFKRHYNVVTLSQVLDAHRGREPLPPRAALLTFDDGWLDNLDHALPELRRAGLPALMFVVADAVGRQQPFWQEQLISAWKRGAVSVPALAARMPGEPTSQGPGQAVAGQDGLPALRRVIAMLEDLPRPARDDILAPFREAMDDGLKHMVGAQDLHLLREGGVALGLHGKSHVRMTRAEDLDAELGGARAALAARLGDASGPGTMSFPHGAFDMDIAQRARDAGYELLFTSVPVLNPTGPGPGWLLGRTGFETDTVVDAAGRFRDDWLAWYLFRCETRALA